MPNWLKIVLSAVKTAPGALGYLQRLALKYGGQALYDLVTDWFRKEKRSAKQEEKKKEMDKVMEKPNSTVEERADAYADYINSN